MNRRLPVVAFALAAIILAAIAGLWLLKPQQAPQGNLSGAEVGGPFTLVDETGKTVTDRSFDGKWRLMYFGFAYCPDICPTDTAKMAEALRLFDKEHPGASAKLAPLFVTVDPERDTPAVLAEFTNSFHPAIIGLTGTPQQVGDMLKAYKIYAQKVPGATAGSYSYDHLAVFYLMDPQNRPVAFLAGQQATPRELADLLARYIP